MIGVTATYRIEKKRWLRFLLTEYLVLVKPFIIALVLIATLSGMYIAGGGLPQVSLIIWTLTAIGLATAGAAALNNFIDKDIDSIMERTQSRPLPAGSIAADKALLAGLSLSVLAVLTSYYLVNPMVALLNAAAIFIYVIPYTLITKRRTPIATFVGGVGGALPPVIGYAAVKPELDVVALALFLIIFTWQHPHFWSLALKYKGEYEKAGVNNLPVVRGYESTKRNIVLWATLMVPASVLPYILGMAGGLYLACALFSSGLFLSLAVWFLFSTRKVAMSLFAYSIIHLPFLFCMMVVDII